MSGLEIAVWLALCAESIILGACLLKAVQARWEGRRRKSSRPAEAHPLLAELSSIAASAASCSTTALRRRTEDLHDQARSSASSDPLAAIIAEFLYDVSDLREACAAAILKSVDRGGVRLYGYLGKTAPPLGVAGTLVGLSILFTDLNPGGGLPPSFGVGLATFLRASGG